jgi:hypothetical protein
LKLKIHFLKSLSPQFKQHSPLFRGCSNKPQHEKFWPSWGGSQNPLEQSHQRIDPPRTSFINSWRNHVKRKQTESFIQQALPVAAVTLTVAALVTACGGGGITGDSDATPITLSGTAATGAPMSGATVVVNDSTGAAVQNCTSTCTVGGDGNFSVPLKSTAKGPFVLLVTQEEGDDPQVSMIDTATSTRVNVTPITTMIAARLAPSGNPADLKSVDLNKEKITAATTEIKVMLKPLLEAAGVAESDDPLSKEFAANSTGIDKALDLLGKPTLSRDDTGKTTLEFALKTSGSDEAADAANASAKFTLSPGVVPVTPANVTAASITLPVDGIGPKIQSLIERMQACYALAPADRRPAGSTLGSQITAEVCKGIFVDNDPSKFLHNNTVVSQAGASLPAGSGGRFTGAFKGIFNNVQGIRHDLPEYRYSVKNGNTSDKTKSMEGDVVFTARWTVTDPKAGESIGQSDVSEYHARLQEGVLKLIGNQSKHDLSVNAQARREEMPGVPAFAYLATGYNINVSERRWDHDNNANTPKVSIYEQVVVTSPSGKVFTLKPIPGNNLDYLGLVNSANTTTKSATIRLNGAYLNASTPGHPSERFSNEFWGSKTEWTEAAIQSIPAQGNWKFEVTFTDAFKDEPANNVTSKTIIQFRRTINRAPTLGELQAAKWPTLPQDNLNEAKTEALQLGYWALGSNNTPEALDLEWEVPPGAWAPVQTKIYSTNWDEGAAVASTARKVTIACKGTGNHCEKANGANTGKFINSGFGYLQLTGRDSKRLQMSLNYSARKTESDLAP